MILSLRKLFLGLLFVAVSALIFSGTLALLFNYQLAQNQTLLIQATTIETSRFTMSSSLSSFLVRESSILTKQNVEDFAQLPSTKEAEQQFLESLRILGTASRDSPDIAQSIHSIETIYQKFLEKDRMVLSLTSSILTTQEQLKNKFDEVKQDVRVNRDLSENIYGLLSLQNE